MTYTREFLPSLDFVYTQATGTIDDQTLMIHFMSFSTEVTGYKVIKELVDIREVRKEIGMTVRGLIRAAAMHQKLFPKKDFFSAVLVDSLESLKAIEIYSFLTGKENLRVKPFSGGLTEPIDWLGYDKDEKARIRRFINNRIRSSRKRPSVPSLM